MCGHMHKLKHNINRHDVGLKAGPSLLNLEAPACSGSLSECSIKTCIFVLRWQKKLAIAMCARPLRSPTVQGSLCGNTEIGTTKAQYEPTMTL